MKLLRDLFTGPDGETYAIGRIYSLPVLVCGLSVPVLMVMKGQTISLTDLAILLPGTGAAVMALVTGTNTTEPKA